MQCVAMLGNFWNSVQIGAPLAFIVHYVITISSLFLGIYIIRNTRASLIGGTAAVGLVASGLALGLHFVVPYASTTLLGGKLVALSIIMACVAALFLYFTVHIAVLRHAPSKLLSLGMVLPLLPVLGMIAWDTIAINGYIANSCYQFQWGYGMYYVYGYLFVLAAAHVYLFCYALYHRMIKRVLGFELFVIAMSLLAYVVLWSVVLYNMEYSQYIAASMYVSIIGISYVALSDKKYGNGLVSSGILVPLLVIVLTSFVMVDDLGLVKQMVVVAGLLVLAVGYVLDRVMSQQAAYEVLLKTQNEELKTLNKNKNEFLSFATHQLKAPLTSIKWGMGTLRESKLNRDQAQIVDQIQMVTSQMVRTVSDFLNSAKLESGNLTLARTAVDVHAMVEKVISEFQPIAHGKGLVLKSQFSENHILANLDEAKIEQVVANLIDNAIKYTTNGSVTVSVSIKGSKIHIDVADTGAGMKSGEAQKLFQKYQRGSAAALNSSGSGIGLYLGKQIVEMHGGELSASSEGKEKGSTFSIVLSVH